MVSTDMAILPGAASDALDHGHAGRLGATPMRRRRRCVEKCSGQAIPKAGFELGAIELAADEDDLLSRFLRPPQDRPGGLRRCGVRPAHAAAVVAGDAMMPLRRKMSSRALQQLCR
jgi:hypothetical protein